MENGGEIGLALPGHPDTPSAQQGRWKLPEDSCSFHSSSHRSEFSWNSVPWPQTLMYITYSSIVYQHNFYTRKSNDNVKATTKKKNKKTTTFWYPRTRQSHNALPLRSSDCIDAPPLSTSWLSAPSTRSAAVLATPSFVTLSRRPMTCAPFPLFTLSPPRVYSY